MVTPNSFYHVALKVANVEDAVDFYREFLDGELVDRGRPDPDETGPTAVEYAALSVGDKLVYVFDRAPYEAAGLVDELPIGFLHFGYVVESVDDAATELEGSVSFVMEPTRFGDLMVAFFDGPGGTRIELLEHLD